jgi:hypothetical protein
LFLSIFCVPTMFFLCAGVVSTSPLRLELEFAPQLSYTWYLCFTFMYLSKIDFSGSRSKQECHVYQIK